MSDQPPTPSTTWPGTAVSAPALPASPRTAHVPPALPLTPVEARALEFLLPLSDDYPGIERWYRRKVVPDLRVERRTLLCVERDGQLVGIGIAKLESTERKICTVRVAPSHAGLGIGVRIFDRLLRWLDADRPHLTVSEAKRPAFERIFEYYGFAVTSQHHGLYVPHACEFAYNELPPHTGSRHGGAAPSCLGDSLLNLAE